MITEFKLKKLKTKASKVFPFILCSEIHLSADIEESLFSYLSMKSEDIIMEKSNRCSTK